MFLNLFFLIMALSQFFPALQVGYIYTYWGPLVSHLARPGCLARHMIARHRERLLDHHKST